MGLGWGEILRLALGDGAVLVVERFDKIGEMLLVSYVPRCQMSITFSGRSRPSALEPLPKRLMLLSVFSKYSRGCRRLSSSW